MSAFPRHVYAIGIAGVGVSAVARYYLVHGAKVSGSDPRPSPLIDDLRQLGADIVAVPNARRLHDVDLVIYSDDVPSDQPERRWATAKKIPTRSFAEALGVIMADYTTRIAVAGTNGKSTTTAILGLLMGAAKKDPTVFVGSRVNEFSGNLQSGQSSIFITEADEYRDHFLHFHPTDALITNVELDHVEYFKTTDRMERSYQEFVHGLPPTGKLVVNADDPASRRLWADHPAVTWFGWHEQSNVRIVDYHTSAEKENFKLAINGHQTVDFELHVPGTYNVMNAVGAMSIANLQGVDWSDMRAPLKAFRGIWRRFEILNHGAATLVVNDYAHHPTSVKAAIEGARAFYPNRRVIAVFQPHHRHRLQALFNEFSAAFAAAHLALITDVYAVPGREVTDPNLPTSQDLAAAIQAHQVPTIYAPSLIDVVNELAKNTKPGDVILLMGAGDIWTIGETIARAYA